MSLIIMSKLQGYIGQHRKYSQYFIITGSVGKASAYNAGDPGSIPGSRRSPGEGNGNPL